MKACHFFAAALLGLATSFSAHAQTPVVGAPGAMGTPGAPATPVNGAGTVVPGQPGTMGAGTMGTGTVGTGVVPPGATAPMTTPGNMPARGVDGGTLRTDQPMANPANPGAQRGRTRTTTPGRTTTRP